MINYKVILYILGVLLIIESFFMMLSVPVALIYKESEWLYIFESAFITLLSGFLLWAIFKTSDKTVGKREGYLVVTLGWVVFSIFGALPFYISGDIPSYTDAFFETMSGFTTTGASILSGDQINHFPYSLHIWRSMTQWLGGMGIIVLSLVILPALGIGGMQLFVAEVPGPTPDKLHPRVRETAKRLWAVYLFITITEILLLWAGEMNLFEAINHSLTTMATGGYSTRGGSIGDFHLPYTHYIISIFMIIAGINFSLSYFALHFKFKPILRNEEIRWYLGFILVFTGIITSLLLVNHRSLYDFESAFRTALFQVSSITTTTGFATVDYLQWIPAAWVIILVLMFLGGSAGSTGGSIKIVRIVLLLKNGFLELKRLIHPNAIIPVRFERKAVKQDIITNVLAFVSVYVLITITSTVIISLMGYDFETSLGSVAATLGNIGPGIGKVGPASNFAHFCIGGKWFLSFLMMIGRLELFTVLVILSPAFWRK